MQLDLFTVFAPSSMSSTSPLFLSEIQTEVCRSLKRPDLCRVARVSRTWNAVATQEIWRVLPGLRPLADLVPHDATSESTISVAGHSYIAYRLEWECPTLTRVVHLARFVQVLEVERAREFDLGLCAGIICTPDLAKNLFPALKKITIPSMLYGAPLANVPSLAVLISAFAHAMSLHIGHLSGVPHCWAFHHVSTFSIEGLKLDVACTLLSLRSAWGIEALEIEAPTATSGADVSKLLTIVAERCVAVHHLSVDVDVFDDGRTWSLTPELLQALSNLGSLTCLRLSLPLVATLGDSHWKAAAWAWPHLQILDIADSHSQVGVHTACTLDGLLSIAVHCPRMTDLCLPAIDCRSIPSPYQTTQAVKRSPSGMGYPLEILHVGDGTIQAPQEVGRFLHTLFYRLSCVSHDSHAAVPRHTLTDWYTLETYLQSCFPPEDEITHPTEPW